MLLIIKVPLLPRSGDLMRADPIDDEVANDSANSSNGLAGPHQYQ